MTDLEYIIRALSIFFAMFANNYALLGLVLGLILLNILDELRK